jgi:hypothetical protein
MTTTGSLRRTVSYSREDAAALREAITLMLQQRDIDIPRLFQEAQIDGLFADEHGDRPMDIKALRDFLSYDTRWRLLGDQGVYERLQAWLVQNDEHRNGWNSAYRVTAQGRPR